MKVTEMDDSVFDRHLRELAAAATSLPAPPAAWDRIVACIEAGDAVVLPTHAVRSASTRTAVRGLRVAAMALLLAGAAAAALPVSPIRHWLSARLASSGAVARTPASIAPADAATTPAPATTLILEPADNSVVVSLEAPARGVSVLVRFAESGQLEVRATGAAVGAQFRSAAGRLTVAHAAGGGLVLTIPRTLARVRVEVDGRAYLTKENGQIRVLAPAADTVGSEIMLQITR